MATPHAHSTPDTPAPASNPVPPPLLHPSTLDVLPALQALLTRLLPAHGLDGPANQADVPATQADIEIHQLAGEASALKIKLQKARVAIRALPDIDRDVAEQEEEIAELEERAQRLRECLRNMGKDPDETRDAMEE